MTYKEFCQFWGTPEDPVRATLWEKMTAIPAHATTVNNADFQKRVETYSKHAFDPGNESSLAAGLFALARSIDRLADAMQGGASGHPSR